MSGAISDRLRQAFKRGELRFRLLVIGICCIAACLLLFVSSKLVRLLTFSYLGNSNAMLELALEYDRDPSRSVRQDVNKSNYWIKKSAGKGNLGAIVMINTRWGYSNPKEVVFWLHKGIEFGHPWCAEQLARGYRYGLYGFQMDPVMEAKYRVIAEELKKKSDH